MKKFGTFLLLLILALPVQAQVQAKLQANATTKKSGKAQQLLNAVAEKVKSYENIELDFEYIMRNTEANMEQETRGNVCLKGNKYRLELMGSTILFDGKKIYSIVPENEEVIISTYEKGKKNMFSPSKMLVFYQEGYDYEWDIAQNVHGRTIQYIRLTPKDEASEVEWILLGIDKHTKHIHNLIKMQEDGTQIKIEINSFKTNQPLPENLFVFKEDKYKNYYINRLD